MLAIGVGVVYIFDFVMRGLRGYFIDIAGKKIANPLATIWSGALMLEHLGHKEAGDAIVRAIETVLKEGPRTRDMGGTANTVDVGKAIAEALA